MTTPKTPCRALNDSEAELLTLANAHGTPAQIRALADVLNHLDRVERELAAARKVIELIAVARSSS